MINCVAKLFGPKLTVQNTQKTKKRGKGVFGHLVVHFRGNLPCLVLATPHALAEQDNVNGPFYLHFNIIF